MHSGHSTTQTVRYSRTLRVSDTADDKNRKTCWPIPVAGPMRHDGEVLSAQFSADGQRLVTASRDKTAQVWDARIIRNQDAPDDVLLLADLAEPACGSVLQTSGQTEILKLLPPDQVRATREKIAAKFGRQSSGLTPVDRLLKVERLRSASYDFSLLESNGSRMD